MRGTDVVSIVNTYDSTSIPLRVGGETGEKTRRFPDSTGAIGYCLRCGRHDPTTLPPFLHVFLTFPYLVRARAGTVWNRSDSTGPTTTLPVLSGYTTEPGGER